MLEEIIVIITVDSQDFWHELLYRRLFEKMFEILTVSNEPSLELFDIEVWWLLLIVKLDAPHIETNVR